MPWHDITSWSRQALVVCVYSFHFKRHFHQTVTKFVSHFPLYLFFYNLIFSLLFLIPFTALYTSLSLRRDFIIFLQIQFLDFSLLFLICPYFCVTIWLFFCSNYFLFFSTFLITFLVASYFSFFFHFSPSHTPLSQTLWKSVRISLFFLLW